MNINNETLLNLIPTFLLGSILLNLWLKRKYNQALGEINERDKIIISLTEQKSSLERSLFS